jgi:hypothetical protein
MTIHTWLPSLIGFFHRQANVEHLRQLDDRLLDDIGIRRDQLDLLALDAPAREPIEESQRRSFRKPALGTDWFARRPRQPTLQGCG